MSTPTPKLPPARVARAIDRLRHHISRLHQRTAPPPIAVLEMIFGTFLAQAIAAAAQLGVADALAGGPLSKDELARRVGADPDALARLMRLLISRGVFRRRRDGRFALNALGDTLRTDAVPSMHGAALFYGSRQHRDNWTQLVEAVRSGTANPPRVFGKEIFEYLPEDPEFANLFNNAMTSLSTVLEAAVVAAYAFEGHSVIADIGGGHGRMLSAILNSVPDARGILFDLPEAVAGAPDVLAQHGVADRVEVVGGSFFESVPTADAYVMKNVIHDWSDDKAVAILGTVKAAAAPGAKLLLLEMVLPDHDREFLGHFADMEMLVMAGAHERNRKQWSEVLSRSGFRISRIVETPGPLCVIEAVPV